MKLGRISYVNMAPVFYRVDAEVEEVQGVPTELNRMLVAGELDTAPISSIPFLLEVAVLMRGREHRAFRRLTGRRLEELLSAARTPPGGKGQAPTEPEPGDAGSGGEEGS